MFGKKLILVIALIFFQNINGAPYSGSALSCADIFVNKNLKEKYADSLTEYLNECNQTQTESALCSLYCDHVKQLFTTGKNVTKAEIDEVLKKQGNQSDFCILQTKLHQKFTIPKGTELLGTTTNCSTLCMNDDKPKPLCSILSLIFTKENKDEKTTSNVAEQSISVSKTDKLKEEGPTTKSVPTKNETKAEVKQVSPEVKPVEHPQKKPGEPPVDTLIVKSTAKPIDIASPKKEVFPVAPDTSKTEKETVMTSSTVKIAQQEENDSLLDTDGDDDNDSANEDDKMLDLRNKDERQEDAPERKPENEQVSDPFYEESGSNFFTYFLLGMFISILLYVLYHNKAKLLGLILEGRRSQKRRTGSRRKHTAAYRKLDSNLEEAMTSSTSGRSSQIIY